MDEHDEHGPFVDDLAVKILIHRMIQVAMLVTRGMCLVIFHLEQ